LLTRRTHQKARRWLEIEKEENAQPDVGVLYYRRLRVYERTTLHAKPQHIYRFGDQSLLLTVTGDAEQRENMMVWERRRCGIAI
jgi:hypothetical protein